MFVRNDDWDRMSREEVWTVHRLSSALREAWSSETCYPGSKEEWTSQLPELGQCAVTSLVVQDFLGGQIVKNDAFHHYWNKLDSGACIDFTRAQFRGKGAIPIETQISRDDILKGDKAASANTTKRYKKLKTMVKRKLKRSDNSQVGICLLSSNARPEYILDIIETLGAPVDTVCSFRYMLKYIEKPLAMLLPHRHEKSSNCLIGCNVAICYLKQTRKGIGEYEWIEILPIREATIVDCYKTGDEDHSIAHFVFKVGKSLSICNESRKNFNAYIRDFAHPQGAYAFLMPTNAKTLLLEGDTGSVFESQCKEIERIGIDYNDSGKRVRYSPPLKVIIEGIYEIQQKEQVLIYPKYDPFNMKSYYDLKEGRSYYYKIRTFSGRESDPSKITLESPKQHFSTPDKYTLHQ